MAFITTKNLKLFRLNSFSFNAAIVIEKVIIQIQKSALFGILFHTQLPAKDKTALFNFNEVTKKKSDSPTENPAFLSDSDF